MKSWRTQSSYCFCSATERFQASDLIQAANEGAGLQQETATALSDHWDTVGGTFHKSTGYFVQLEEEPIEVVWKREDC